MKLKHIWLSKLSALMLLCGTTVSAQNLQSIEVVNLGSQSQEIRYHFDASIGDPKHLMRDNTIILDFDRVNLKTYKNRTVNTGLVSAIRNIASSSKVRSTIVLTTKDITYQVAKADQSVIVTLNANSASQSGRNTQANVAIPDENVIDFRRNSNGAAVIDIQLPSENTPVQIIENNRNLTLRLNGHQWSKGQEKRLEVTDFATPVKQIEIINNKGVARVNIVTQSNFEYSAVQKGKRYTVEVKPKRKPVSKPASSGQSNTGNKDNFSGNLLSLNFQDIEVRAVLQIIADFTGLNIVVSDSVNSRVTVRLIDVPWDQALDVILKTKGLGMRQKGNVMYIAPLGELNKLEDEVDLISEIVQINYAKAADIAKVLLDGKAGVNSGVASAGLSRRGTVSVDPRTNNLIIQDTDSQLRVVKDLIAVLDKPVRQVQIDAKVVIATDNFARDLGVRWGLSGESRVRTDSSGNLQSGNFFGGGINSNVERINGTTIGDDRIAVNLPAINPIGSLAVSVLRRGFLAELELSAMQQDGRGEILASPRVVTADRQTAYIKSGREVPFTKQDGDGNTTVEFKEVVLELNVTPQITPDDKIILDLLIKKDEIGQLVNDTASIDKNEIKTQAIVANGETVVLGGVYNELNQETIKRIPFLSDIPFIGKLFQNKNRRHEKLELLIFVTPQIKSIPTRR